jgi:hypothetical protein
MSGSVVVASLNATPRSLVAVSEPTLPETSSDERAVGWGEEVSDEDRERSEDERFNAERPPHHDRD